MRGECGKEPVYLASGQGGVNWQDGRTGAVQGRSQRAEQAVAIAGPVEEDRLEGSPGAGERGHGD
jgi:hypothetical protein